MKTDAFRRFLKKALANPAGLVKVELVLLSAKGATSVVDTVKIEDPRDWTSEDRFDELVGNLAETAQADANGFGSPSKYYLRAKFDDASAGTPRSTVVSVHPDDGDIDGDDYGGEPANAAGLVAQAHRHTEAFARQLVAQTGIFTQHATELMARMSEANQRFERERMQSFELISELHDRRHERELELRKEERKDKAIGRLVDGVVPLLPIAGGKLLLGPKAPTQVKNSPQMVSLRELAKSFTADDMARLQEALGPERFAAILEVLLSVSETEEEKPNEGTSDDNGSNSDERSPNDSGGPGKWH